MWFKLRLNVRALIVAVAIVAVVVGFLGGTTRDDDDLPYPLYVLAIMVVTFAIFILLVPTVRREYKVSINPAEGRIRIGRREFPASEVVDVQGMFAESAAANSQVDYILFVKVPHRKKPYRGKFAIKLPYVKARTKAELEAIVQIIPQFGIPDRMTAAILRKRNRSFQSVGKDELLKVAKFEMQREYPPTASIHS